METRTPSAIVLALEAQAHRLSQNAETLRETLRDRDLPVVLRLKAALILATSTRLLDETAKLLRRARALTGEEVN